MKTTDTICQWFGLKTTTTVSPGLASKLVMTVFFFWFGLKTSDDSFSRFGFKTGGLGFLVCVSKLVASI
jgi:hypothetical protein